MNPFIRRMILKDVEQVTAIDKASFSMPWPERSFISELMDNPASRSWVAELDGHIVGMAVVWLIVDEAHIATIAVHPDHRRQGIGENMLVHILKSVKDEGAVRAFLEVRASNVAAQHLYRKYGFVEDGRRPRYYKDNQEDAILMSLGRIDL